MIFGCPQGGKKAFDLAKEIFVKGHRCCQTWTGAKSFLWKLMQASSGWGQSFFKKGPREKLIFILISPAKAFNSSQQNYSAVKRGVVGGDVCAGEVETFFVVPKILLGEWTTKVLTYLNDSSQQNGGWTGWVFFQEYDFEDGVSRGGY